MRHSGEKQYKCPFCTYSSIQSSTYKIHLKSKHPDQATKDIVFHCSKCMFKTLKEGNFLAHLAEHRKEGDDSSAELIGKEQIKVKSNPGTSAIENEIQHSA